MTTVLIVDDHDGFRHQARRLLEAAGYDVVGEAADGASAIADAARLRPDAVLLDVQLPDIDGFEVASRLERCRVVLISGRDASIYRERLRSRPALHFIPKGELTRESFAVALAR